jgi:hypothetical protein
MDDLMLNNIFNFSVLVSRNLNTHLTFFSKSFSGAMAKDWSLPV